MPAAVAQGPTTVLQPGSMWHLRSINTCVKQLVLDWSLSDRLLWRHCHRCRAEHAQHQTQRCSSPSRLAAVGKNVKSC
jgi:hypothetical protein